jgi:hypothetical protein
MVAMDIRQSSQLLGQIPKQKRVSAMGGKQIIRQKLG